MHFSISKISKSDTRLSDAARVLVGLQDFYGKIKSLNLWSFSRSQCVDGGYEFFAQRKLVTVFSAPDYRGYGLPGAVMSVDKYAKCTFQLLHASRDVCPGRTAVAASSRAKRQSSSSISESASAAQPSSGRRSRRDDDHRRREAVARLRDANGRETVDEPPCEGISECRCPGHAEEINKHGRDRRDCQYR